MTHLVFFGDSYAAGHELYPDNVGTFASITFLDSPNTTSSTQYSLYVRSASSSQSVKMGEDASNYTITAIEVLP